MRNRVPPGGQIPADGATLPQEPWVPAYWRQGVEKDADIDHIVQRIPPGPINADGEPLVRRHEAGLKRRPKL